MPAQGATLDDRKIAAVLSYIRSDWGNSAPPVKTATVTALREKFLDHAPWTAADLDALKD
jgi:mono/diheme cytochrome c family protein